MNINYKLVMHIIALLLLIIIGVLLFYMLTPKVDVADTYYCPSCNPTFAPILACLGIVGFILLYVLKEKKEVG